jgi:DNA-directed RNA polymerase subunit F
MDVSKVVKYISTVEPQLEKVASDKQRFISKLQEKVAYATRVGTINSDKANKMLKEAMDDPSTVLNYLEIPNTFTHKIGTPVNKSSYSNRNAMVDFVMS